MKPKYWIDCPICNVKMEQGRKRGVALEFMCPLCDTVTLVPVGESSRREYRRQRLEERRIK